MVGRFAPSPSGRMHLGNVFTALIAWLSVRSQGGTMLLRIEDLDPERSREEYITALREDLLWLGLDWDAEMPRQSTRTQAYAEAFFRLKKEVYPCFCTRAELHIASAPHASDGTFIYPGTCRGLSATERSKMRRAPAWRIRVPDCTIRFNDGLFGEISENLAEQCGDFVLRRADGVYAYQLAVVCDDAFGGVTQVVRGADLLSSTARQIWLFERLGYPAPQYFHIPLLVAPDGRRLSKRERALDLAHLRRSATPEQLIGLLAFRAGLIDCLQKISAKELLSVYAPEKLRNAPIILPDSPLFP